MESVSDENSQPKGDDALLIELVSQFPCLYDKQLRDYRNHSLREAAWTTISELMNMLPSECTKRWSQLRDNFGREKRRRDEESRSGSGLSQRRGFSLYESMRFLERYVQKRSTFSNIQFRSSASRDEFEHNSQLERGYFSTICPDAILPPSGTTIAENSGMVQLAPLVHQAQLEPPPPVAITMPSGSAIMPTLISPITQRMIPPSSMTALSSDTTTSTKSPSATNATESTTMTSLPALCPVTLLAPFSSVSTGVSPARAITPTGPVIVTTISLSSLATSTREVTASTLMSSPPIITARLPAIVTTATSSSLDTIRDSPASPLILPSPATTPTPPPIVTTTFSSPDMSTRSNLSKTPTTLSCIFTPTHCAMSSCSPSSISPCTSDSSMESALSPTVMKQRNGPWHSVPTSGTSSSSRCTNVCMPTSSNDRFNLDSNIKNTAGLNKKFGKQKKIDPVESSFLNLSEAIQNHLTSRIQTQEKTTDKIPASPGDEALANLIITELANLDDQKKAAKKAKLMKVLYEEE